MSAWRRQHIAARDVAVMQEGHRFEPYDRMNFGLAVIEDTIPACAPGKFLSNEYPSGGLRPGHVPSRRSPAMPLARQRSCQRLTVTLLIPTARVIAITPIWHRARDFHRRTRQRGRHGGAVGHAALQVLHSLVFDFLNSRSGRLDPS